MKMKARVVVGRGEEGTLCDPGSELYYYWEGGPECSVRIVNVRSPRFRIRLSSSLVYDFVPLAASVRHAAKHALAGL